MRFGLKSAIILTNSSEDHIKPVKADQLQSNRIAWSSVESCKWAVYYLKPHFQEFQIESDLVFLHFWLNTFRLRACPQLQQSSRRLLTQTRIAYNRLCQSSGLPSRLDSRESTNTPVALDKQVKSPDDLLKFEYTQNLSAICKTDPWSLD